MRARWQMTFKSWRTFLTVSENQWYESQCIPYVFHRRNDMKPLQITFFLILPLQNDQFEMKKNSFFSASMSAATWGWLRYRRGTCGSWSQIWGRDAVRVRPRIQEDRAVRPHLSVKRSADVLQKAVLDSESKPPQHPKAAMMHQRRTEQQCISKMLVQGDALPDLVELNFGIEREKTEAYQI